MNEQRIREIYAATIGFSGGSDDVAFGMAVAREALAGAATSLAKLTRFGEIGDYSGARFITSQEDGEFVQFDDVREMLEGLTDAPLVRAGEKYD